MNIISTVIDVHVLLRQIAWQLRALIEAVLNLMVDKLDESVVLLG